MLVHSVLAAYAFTGTEVNLLRANFGTRKTMPFLEAYVRRKMISVIAAFKFYVFSLALLLFSLSLSFCKMIHIFHNKTSFRLRSHRQHLPHCNHTLTFTLPKEALLAGCNTTMFQQSCIFAKDLRQRCSLKRRL